MRQFKAILFIILIAKSTFGMDLMTTYRTITGSSCHSEIPCISTMASDSNTNLTENVGNQESENKGCCEDGVCECVCCGHVFTTKATSKTFTSYTEPPVKHEYFYKENYHYNNIHHIWQPPQNI